MSKIRFVRLKAEYQPYLTVASSAYSITIKVGGENDPNGFEADEVTYERIKKYVELVPKKRRKSETKEIVNLEE